METKVLDNGPAYVTIRSQDGRQTIEFMTVHPNHERTKVDLRDYSIPKEYDTCAKSIKVFKKRFEAEPHPIDQHKDEL